MFTHNIKNEFHENRNLVFVIFVFCMATVLSFLSTGNMTNSSAANTADFKPGNIISDAVMANYNTMSVSEIQAFLDSKNKCNNTDYNYYLQLTKSQPTINWHWAGEPYNGHFVCMAEEKFGDGEVIGTGMTAAEIIYDAAQVNKINPQVLLVLLQKESSLITDKVPNDFDYRKATGYGCPDTAACDSKYYGFKNQIYRAAELFRYTLDKGSATYREGHNAYVGYHPNSSCGGTTVFIENRATASLYRYTPYQPNSAALNAGYGQGNSCSAYGNRNFYLYFTDWFGSTQAAVDGELAIIPDGMYSLVSASNAQLAISSASSPIKNGTNVIVESQKTVVTKLNITRDIDSGYYAILDVNSGKALDLTSANTDYGTNIQFWHRDVNTCAQKWKFYRSKDNYLIIESACMPGTVMEFEDDNIQLGVANNHNNQKWKLHFGQVIEDGVYNLALTDSPSLALQYSESNYTNGSRIYVDQGMEGLISERWLLSYSATGDYYTIKNVTSGRAIDLSNAKTVDNTNIQLWQHDKNTCAQRWHLLSSINDPELYTIVSACSERYAIGFANKVSGKTNVSLQSIDNGNPASWSIAPAEQIVADGDYRIASSNNQNFVLDVSNGGKTNGTNVQGWSLDRNTGAQKWQIEYQSKTDTYLIINPQSNKVIDLSNAHTNNGSNLQIWQYDANTCAQRWIFVADDAGRYTIHSSCNYNFVADLSNNRTVNGTNLQIWSHDPNTLAQRWLLLPIE